MKRNMDLIRLILLDVEGETKVDFSPYSEREIKYNAALLIEGEYLDGIVHYQNQSDEDQDIPDLLHIKKLTWEGHEFLDKARSDTIWNKAKSLVKDKGLTFSIDIAKIALGEVIKGCFHPSNSGN